MYYHVCEMTLIKQQIELIAIYLIVFFKKDKYVYLK